MLALKLPHRPRSLVSTTKRTLFSGPRAKSGCGGASLSAVDGDALRVEPEKGTRLHIEVLPGVHEVSVEAPELVQSATVRFMAEAGHVYRMIVTSAPTEPGRVPLLMRATKPSSSAAAADCSPWSVGL